jgi:hypothetical protein
MQRRGVWKAEVTAAGRYCAEHGSVAVLRGCSMGWRRRPDPGADRMHTVGEDGSHRGGSIRMYQVRGSVLRDQARC